MKETSVKKLEEWKQNAIRKGLDPEDMRLYISERGLKEQPPETPPVTVA